MTLYCADLTLTVNPSSIVVGEDGSGEFVAVTKTGYSFGAVEFYLRTLTYSEYESLTGRTDLDTVFYRPQTEASGETITHTCR